MPRNRIIKIRFSIEEFEELSLRAEMDGCPIAEIVRRIVFKQPIILDAICENRRRIGDVVERLDKIFKG